MTVVTPESERQFRRSLAPWIGLTVVIVFISAVCYFGRKRSPVLPPARPIQILPSDPEALVELLAVDSTHRLTPYGHPVPVVHRAYDKLVEKGKEAFPALLAHLDDDRPSVTDRAVETPDVKFNCRAILTDILCPVPYEYQRRQGSPVFGFRLFLNGTIDEWLKEREHMTVEEINIEALSWMVEQESALGFRDDTERERILGPLQRRIAEIKSKSLKEQLSP